MSTQLIIDGNAVYEIDEECLACQKKGKSASLYRRNENNLQTSKCKIHKDSAADFASHKPKNSRNPADDSC